MIEYFFLLLLTFLHLLGSPHKDLPNINQNGSRWVKKNICKVDPVDSKWTQMVKQLSKYPNLLYSKTYIEYKWFKKNIYITTHYSLLRRLKVFCKCLTCITATFQNHLMSQNNCSRSNTNIKLLVTGGVNTKVSILTICLMNFV